MPLPPQRPASAPKKKEDPQAPGTHWDESDEKLNDPPLVSHSALDPDRSPVSRQLLDFEKRNPKALAITVGVIVVMGVGLFMIGSGPGNGTVSFSRSRGDGAESGIASGEKASPARAVSGPLQAAVPSDALANLEIQRAERDAAFQFGVYDDYLESLSRKLTPAEEDAILVSSGRDPQVLLGLVVTGSSRASQFLREALEKSPENPLVHYEVLRRADSGFDRLASAQKLASLVPNDAELWYAAAAEALAVGNRTLATEYLRNAASQPDFASLHASELAARAEAYQWGGAAQEMALAKLLLGNNQTLGDVALVRLHEFLMSDGSPGAFKIAPGNEQLAALLLNAYQKEINAKGLTLDSYYAARGNEMEYLKAFFRAGVSGENPAAAQYLTTPASQLLSIANAEWQEIEPIAMFGWDKPGIYKRLSGDQQQELIGRIQKDGDVAAFLWAYEERPDIFRSPDFKPQGYSKKAWTEYLKRAGVAPGANQKR